MKNYTDSDFKEINVRVTQTNKQLPIDIQTINISDLNMGERIPVCNRPEFIEKAYNTLVRKENWREKENSPEKADIVRLYRQDNKIYIVACYGTSRTGYYEMTELFYEWAVFCYDLDTKKSQEIFSWSSDSLNKKCYEIQFCFGKLFFAVSEPEKNYVKAVDLSSKNEMTILENNSSDKYWIFSDGEEYVILSNENNEERYYYNIKEDKIYYAETYYEEMKDKYAEMMDLPALEAVESIAIGEDFYFTSDQFLGIPMSTEKTRFTFSSGYRVDTFDITKMEHYFSSLDDVGVPSFVRDGKIFMVGKNDIKCLVPDMGLVYNVIDNGQFDAEMIISADIICDHTEGNEKLYVFNYGLD
jgi:hypothetical protein